MWHSAGAGNAKVAQLSEQLEEEKAEARQRTAEAERLSALLREKERLLIEAGELMKEAERQCQAQQEKQDSLLAENSSLAAEMEALRTASAEQAEKVRALFLFLASSSSFSSFFISLFSPRPSGDRRRCLRRAAGV